MQTPHIMFNLLLLVAAVGGSQSPSFEFGLVQELIVQQGSRATLTCTVRHLGNQSVSWIRVRDKHILTVGQEVFVSDARVGLKALEDNATFMLQISNVMSEDAGRYECQVSTEPKLSRLIDLKVEVPEVRIFGEKELLVREGSSVVLKCVVSRALRLPNYIEWTRNEQRLQSGVSVDGRMHVGVSEHIAETTALSTLTLSQTRPEDSADYACHPAEMHADVVRIHVVHETDTPAAMQTSRGTTTTMLTSMLMNLGPSFIFVATALAHQVQ